MLSLQNHVWVDVTLHNTTLPPLAIKNPECLGLLHQLDRSKDVWIQHYCILKDGCLYFYATLRSTPAQGRGNPERFQIILKAEMFHCIFPSRTPTIIESFLTANWHCSMKTSIGKLNSTSLQ